VVIASALLLTAGILFFRWYGESVPGFVGTIIVILIGVVSAPLIGIPVGWVAWKIINRQPKPPQGRTVSCNDHEWIVRRYDATLESFASQNDEIRPVEMKYGR
jgi:hypothetical protein